MTPAVLVSVMPLLWLHLLLLAHLQRPSLCFKSKGDDIIILGGGGGGGGAGGAGPIIMEDGGKRGKGNTIIIIPPSPPPPHHFPRPHEAFMDSMYGSASYEAMPVMSHAPPMHSRHENPYHMPPPPPFHRMPASHVMPPPQSYYRDSAPVPETVIKKKKKKKKKKPKPSTTTTTTTTPPPPVVAMHYGGDMSAPGMPSALFDNFYSTFTSENSNNQGYGNAQSSYNMPAMMKMMQQYSNDGGGSNGGGHAGPDAPSNDGGGDRGGHGNTFEFPKIPQIIIKVPAPIVNVPQPIVNVPAAVVNVSVPEIRIPQTQVTVPAPIVNVPTPVVNVPAANVSVNVPNISVPPAVVNVPKKLVLKKEFRITSDTKSMKGQMAGKSMGYNQMADSEHINFDEDEEDGYSSAGSSQRQDKTSAEVIYDRETASVQSPGDQESPEYSDYGSEGTPPSRPPPTLASKPLSSLRRQRPQNRLHPTQRHASDARRRPEGNQLRQSAQQRPMAVHYDSRDTATPSHQSDPRLTPLQQHFAQSPPEQYQGPAVRVTIPVRVRAKQPGTRAGDGRTQRQQQAGRQHLSQVSPALQFDDEATAHAVSEFPDSRGENTTPGGQSKPVSAREMIDFFQSNNFKPLTSNPNLHVMSDDKKEPNIIFEQTDSPVPMSVSFEADQTVFEDKGSFPPARDANSVANSHPTDQGIVFEDIPSQELSSAVESHVPSSDALIYDDPRGASPYAPSASSLSFPQQQSSHFSEQVAASLEAAQTRRPIFVHKRKTLTRRRKKVHSPPPSLEVSSHDSQTPTASMPIQLASSSLSSPSPYRLPHERRPTAR